MEAEGVDSAGLLPLGALASHLSIRLVAGNVAPPRCLGVPEYSRLTDATVPEGAVSAAAEVGSAGRVRMADGRRGGRLAICGNWGEEVLPL